MPKIEKINLELKYSKEIQDGEWKGIALGAEASLGTKETAREARQALQNILATELRLAWAESTRGEPSPAVPFEGRQAQAAVGDEEIDEMPDHHQDRPPARRARIEETPRPTLEDEEFVKPPVHPSWCAVHQCKMKMRNWGGYSHQVGKQWCHGKWCSIHNVPLYKNEKDGSVWYTHAYEDPDTGERIWCRGEKQPRQPLDIQSETWPEEEIPF